MRRCPSAFGTIIAKSVHLLPLESLVEMELAAASSATEITATRTASRAEAAYLLLLLIVRRGKREGEWGGRSDRAAQERSTSLLYPRRKREGAHLLSFVRAPKGALFVSYTCDVHTDEGEHYDVHTGRGGSDMAKLY